MFKYYRKKGAQGMRPYVEGEDMAGISVSEPDSKLDSLLGGMVAVSSDDPTDMWYVAKKFFDDIYVEV